MYNTLSITEGELQFEIQQSKSATFFLSKLEVVGAQSMGPRGGGWMGVI